MEYLQKIGLLGGSFDPPHFGHIGISKEALNLLNLDEVWWLITKQNPLKTQKSSNFEQRQKLCEKITKNEPKIKIVDLEKNLKTSYFVDLLKVIKEKYPKNEFFFLIGSDSLVDFHLWHDWQNIINLTKIAVFEREGYEKEAQNSKAAIFCQELSKKDQKERLIFIKNQKYNISSTMIRNKKDQNYNFIVDSHCHLDLVAEKENNIDSIVNLAQENNVKVLQTICTRISKFDNIYKYAQKYENVFASVGNHPCNVDTEKAISAKEIIDICNKHEKLIGIGETGLDYYHDKSLKEKQISSFKEHITAARETGLPLIIHNRDSDYDMVNILKDEMKKGQFKALLHCFSSSAQLAQEALELGIYISISGIVTFKNAVSLQEIVKTLPLNRILVETDSPYLAPIPYRGQMNQPAYTKNTAQFIANLKEIDEAEFIHATTKNFFDLFTKAIIKIN